MTTTPYISADIGGSHITCAAIDPSTKSIIADSITGADVDNKASAQTIIDTWCNALKQTINKAGGCAGIGFAMPGPFDYVNGISKIKGVQKYDSLFGLNIQQAISEKLGLNASQPVRFINDATAFAIGECWSGIAAGKSKVMALTLGTGFGSAFINKGLPVLNGDSVPKLGCVYHLPFKESIADDYFSTRWFLNNWSKKGGEPLKGVKEIAMLAKDGNEMALSLFKEFGQNMGQFLAPWIKRFNAGYIVVGGNISNANDLFLPSLKKALKENEATIEIGFSGLQEEAALLGGARLLDNAYYTEVLPLLSLM
ncbi:ROK family protein [Marinilabiliaceae bacterium JC017]|nr:ROK family protein [Marinilabiliaceae bacterium JC017]